MDISTSLFPNFVSVLVKAPQSALRKLLNEDVVEILIWHEVQLSALLGIDTTSEFNNSHSTRVWTVP